MRRPLKIGLLSGTTLLVAALLIVPGFFDRESLRRSLTEQLTNALGHPIAIESLRIALLPRPTVVLENTVADLGPAGTDLRIGRVHAALSWRALVRGKLALRHLDIEAMQLDRDLVARIRGLFPPSASADASAALPVRLHEATVRGLTWRTAEGLILGPFDTDLSWKDALRPAVVEIRQADGKLHVRLLPDSDGISIALQAQDWAIPGKPQWRFGRLRAEGRYAGRRIEIDSAEGESFGGHWRFAGAVAWSDIWQVDGKLAGTDLELPLLLALAGKPPIPGRIDGQCTLSLQAATPGALYREPGLECTLGHTVDTGQARIDLHTRPVTSGLGYRVSVENLTLPVGPALHFQKAEASGLLRAQSLGIEKLRGSAYQGDLEGGGELRWDGGWHLRFDAGVRGVQIEPVLAAFGKRTLKGPIDARCKGTLRGDTFRALGGTSDIGCEFRVTDGVIYNADLEQAATLVKRSQPSAGSTPFDTLEGSLRLIDRQTRFDPIRIHSSALEAAGTVNIAPTRQLSGELSVGLKNTGGMVSIPLAVSGTTDDPVVRPTNSALAGGAAGTLMLGPGIGTAIGVKVGEAVQKFGQWLKPGAADTPAR
ncbi:MAG: AsmA family protein [Gammaproteobacteria bacterium]|nr:AsmA family protein [Gammaproteobacteria bacterium]